MKRVYAGVVGFLVVALILVSAYSAELSSTVSSQNLRLQRLQSEVVAVGALLNVTRGTLTVVEAELNNIAGRATFSDSQVWLSNASVSQRPYGHDSWNFSAAYPGYIVVKLVTTNNSQNYITVSWTASGLGVSFNQTALLSHPGSAAFPVLPNKLSGSTTCSQASCLVSTVVTISMRNESPRGVAAELLVTYYY